MYLWRNCSWRNSRVHSGYIIYCDKTRLWVIIGANNLVNITEVSTAYGTYYWLGKSKLNSFSRASIATLAELSLGNITIRIIILIWLSIVTRPNNATTQWGQSGFYCNNYRRDYRKSLRAVLKFSTGLFPARHQRGGVAAVEAVITVYLVS